MDELFKWISLSSWITSKELKKFNNFDVYHVNTNWYAKITYNGNSTIARIVDIEGGKHGKL